MTDDARRGLWRVGSNYGIHVYEIGPTSPEGDRSVGTFHRPEDAAEAVAAVNAARHGTARGVDSVDNR